MSTVLKLLAGVVLASIFIGIFITVWSKYSEGAEETEFKNDAEEMANEIKFLNPGSQIPSYNITVPEGCELRFENKAVIADTNGGLSYDTGVELIGPTLDQGSYELTLQRTENGVEINAE